MKEGTADAVAFAAARKRFPGKFPVVDSDRSARKFSGLRHYDVPLNSKLKNNNGKVIYTGLNIHYYTSSFWRHLAEAYHQGEYGYLHEFFLMRPKHHDWLAWLDRRLVVDKEVGMALGPVYAVFLADFAGWHASGFPGAYFSEKTWLHRAFSGCTTLTLNKEQAHASVTLPLRRSSGKCIRVQIKGIVPKERVTVKVLATAVDSLVAVDQLHVSLASTTDQSKFSCAHAIRKNPKSGRRGCLLAPDSGTLEIEELKMQGRAWTVIPQGIDRGHSFENLYIVSRTVNHPSDFPNWHDAGTIATSTIHFMLDVADMQIHGATKTAGKSKKTAVGHLNLHPAVNAQEGVPMHSASGKPTTSFTQPTSLMPSLASAIPTLPSTIKDLSVLNFTLVDVVHTGLFEEQLRETGSLQVTPLHSGKSKKLRPIKLGTTGSFAAHIFGTIDGKLYVAREPGKMVVEEFTPYTLRAQVSGSVCNIMKATKKNPCPDRRQIKATMIKAMAGLYLPNARFVVVDTPGTKIYRDIKSQFAHPQSFQPAPPITPDRPTIPDMSSALGGISGGSLPTDCKCRCSDMDDLQALAKEVEAAGGVPGNDLQTRIKNFSKCASSCGNFYASCKLPRKKRKRRKRRRR